MKRKGFTLVELLAVIVILAVIALIAVPMIVGVIEKSRRGALQNSGYGLVEAGTLYYAEVQNGKTVRFDIKDNEVTSKEENKLAYKGTIKEGTVLINNKGEVTVCINDGKYAAYKNFSDNKVTIVDNKTCTIPENSNIVYLDNEATINVNIEELVSQMNEMSKKIESLENEIGILKEEKSNQSDVTSLIANLTNTHNSDMNSVNTRLDSLISNLNSMISDNLQSKIHNIDIYHNFVSSTDVSYTGASLTIPAHSSYCITAAAFYVYGNPLMVSIAATSTNRNPTYSDNSTESEVLTKLSTTLCGSTTEDTTYYIWARYASSSNNAVQISGFYIH